MPEPVGDLAAAFVAPPDSTRPYVLWMWMGCNISKQGITADLEAMHEAGIGGATIFSLADTLIPWAGVIGKSPTPEVVTWTEPWWGARAPCSQGMPPAWAGVDPAQLRRIRKQRRNVDHAGVVATGGHLGPSRPCRVARRSP